jgi:hypothetical protein
VRPAGVALWLDPSAEGDPGDAPDGLGSALTDVVGVVGVAAGEGSPGPDAAPHPPRHMAATVDTRATATIRHRPVAMAANLAGPR